MLGKKSRLIAALAIALSFGGAGSAEAAFAPGNEEVAGALQFSATGFAGDAQGNTLIAWRQVPTLGAPHEVKARRLAVDGTLGPVFDPAPGEIASEPAVGMSPAGRGFIAWQSRASEGDPRSVKGRWVEPDGAMGPVLTIAIGQAGVLNAVQVFVAVDSSGVATVCWKNEVGNVLALRRVQPDGTMSATLPDISEGAVTEPEIAALPNGSTLAVWRGTGIEKSVVTAALAVSPAQTISETNTADSQDLAVDGFGNVLVVWRQSTATEYSVRARRLDPAGAAVGTETIVDPLSEEFVNQVRAAADSQGDFLLLWNRQDSENHAILLARPFNVLGAFAGPAQPLSAVPFSASFPRAALFDAGGGPVVWHSRFDEDKRVVGRTVDPLGAPASESQELLAGVSVNKLAVAAVPALGVATFLVEYPTSGASGAAVVRRFLLPPACAGSSATVVQGQPIAAPLACSGPAIESAQVLEQPRHGTLGAFDRGALSLAYTPNPRFAGTDSFTYTVANDGGSSTAATVTIAVGKDTVKPRITQLRLRRIVPKGKRRAAARRRPSFQFRLAFSEPATATVVVKKVVRKHGKARLRKVGKVALRQPQARVTIAIRRRLAKKLAAGGRFRAIAVATDPAGNRSKPKRIAFRLRG